jgi:serralysin
MPSNELAETIGLTGNPLVDGLLQGSRWTTPVLTFSFTHGADDYEPGHTDGALIDGFVPMGTHLQEAVRRILTGISSDGARNPMSVSAVALLSFEEATGDEVPDAVLRFGGSTGIQTAQGWFPIFPGTTEGAAGDIWVNSLFAEEPDQPGTYVHATLAHEIGHALGLKHPHDILEGSGPKLTILRDALQNTLMSYRSYPGVDPFGYLNAPSGYPAGFMQLDLLALQHLYGVNYATRSGSTVYAFDPETGALLIDGVAQVAQYEGRVFQTLWDGGGEDLLDLSAFGQGSRIDLRPGAWTTFDTARLATIAREALVPDGIRRVAPGNLAMALLPDPGDLRPLIEDARGGAGRDTIIGNDAANGLDGAAGADSLHGGNGADTLRGADGADTLRGGAGLDALAGGKSHDLLLGGEGQDSLSGGSGNDTAHGEEGDDLVAGGEGNDLLHGGRGGDLAMGGDGNDSLYGSEGGDTLFGGTDAASGTDGLDTLAGGAGDDSLDGGGGADLVKGGAGRDTVEGKSGHDRLLGGEDDDLMFGGSGADLLRGEGGADTLHGGVPVIDVDGLAGGDSLYGLGGDDAMFGGEGNDRLVGGDGDDLLDGGAHPDRLLGGAGADTFMGGSEEDALISEADGAADVFVFFFTGDEAQDPITGFEHGIDLIRLPDAAADSVLEFGVIPTGEGPTLLYYGDIDRWLLYDADGAGPGYARTFARFREVVTLSIGDFVLGA